MSDESLDLEKQGKKSVPGWRVFVVWLMVVLGSLCSFFGVFAVWVTAVALDTNTFTDTVAPLISEDPLARAVSVEAVKLLFEQAGVEKAIQKELPKSLEFAAEPLAGGLQKLAEEAARAILKTRAFQSVWREALRSAHASAVAVIRNEEGIEINTEGEVELDLIYLLDSIRKSLADSGVDSLKGVKISGDAGKVVLFTSGELGAAKQVVNVLDTLNWVFPVLAMLFFVVAVIAAGDRRKALLIVGAGLVLAMALGLVAVFASQPVVLGKIGDTQLRAAADVVWSGLTGGLIAAQVIILVIGALIVAGAVLAGPYGWAVKLRSGVAGVFRRKEQS